MANRSHVDFDNPSPTLLRGSSDKRRSLQSNTRKMPSSVSRFPRIFGALIALIVLGGLFATKFAIADSRVSTAADGSSGPVLLGGVPKIPVFPGAPGTGGTPDSLIVWAGDAAHKSPDFIAVVDMILIRTRQPTVKCSARFLSLDPGALEMSPITWASRATARPWRSAVC
jgi:hypothetical protein